MRVRFKYSQPKRRGVELEDLKHFVRHSSQSRYNHQNSKIWRFRKIIIYDLKSLKRKKKKYYEKITLKKYYSIKYLYKKISCQFTNSSVKNYPKKIIIYRLK